MDKNNNNNDLGYKNKAGYSDKDNKGGNSHTTDKSSADKDQDKDLDVDADKQGFDTDKDQELSLLSRILHNGVLGAFTSTFTADNTLTIPTPITPTTTSQVATIPSVPRTMPVTLNNKGDEENSPVIPLSTPY